MLHPIGWGRAPAAFHDYLPPLGSGGACDGIDADPFHERELKHEPGVADRIASPVVLPTADGGEQIVVTGEGHGGDDVGGSSTADDECRMPVDAERNVVSGYAG